MEKFMLSFELNKEKDLISTIEVECCKKTLAMFLSSMHDDPAQKQAFDILVECVGIAIAYNAFKDIEE